MSDGQKNKIVCLCGSLRFKKEFGEIELMYALEGWIVLTPCCMYVDAERTDGFKEHKKIFDKVHKKKIEIADLIYIINKDNYIGESTSKEIVHAELNDKKIIYLCDY